VRQGLDVRPADPGADDVAVAKLDEGERAAIALAPAVKAELPDLQPRGADRSKSRTTDSTSIS
jgi:hypothetical protein